MFSTTKQISKSIVYVSISLILLMSIGFADYDADGVDLLGRSPYGYCPFVVAQGEYAYAANGTVFEVMDIHTLVPQGEVVFESIVSSIAVSGNYAYIANWSDGFKVIDITDPVAPQQVAQIDFPGQCFDLSLDGDYAYLGNGDEGLRIIDISNPLLPTHASTFTPVEAAIFEYTQVIDTIAYSATQSGLYILDISDPTAPLQLGYSPAENGAWSVHVVDTIAYLPKWGDGIRLVNIADPTSPAELGYFQTPDDATWIEIRDSLAYVAERWSGIQILDISDITTPDSVGMIEMDYADAIHFQGDSMYVAASSWGVKSFDMSDPLNPILLYENPMGGYSLDAAFSGDYVYASYRSYGIRAFQRLGNDSLAQVGQIELEAPNKLSIRGDRLFATNDGNLQIIDISDPTNMQILNTWEEGFVTGVTAYRHYLYITGWPDLQILDVGDPNNIQLLGVLDDLPSSAYEIAINGGFAFLANRGGGMHIIDIRDPVNPQHTSSFYDAPYCWSVAVTGKYAFLADRGGNEIHAVDVSNPQIPVGAGTFSSFNRLEDVQAFGRYVYALDSWEGVRVLDFGDPTNPQEVGYFNTGGFARGFSLENGTMAVADGGGGLYLLDTELNTPNFTVNSTGDESDMDPGDGICDDGSGDCTLRAAIEEANAYPGYNIIFFDIPGDPPHYIQPLTELPAVEDPADINGRSEPDWNNGPAVAIQGMNSGESNGIVFRQTAAFSRMIGVNVSGFNGTGVLLEGSGHSIIYSYIGTDIGGTTSHSNNTGIEIMGPYNRVVANLISGNTGSGVGMYSLIDEGFDCHHSYLANNKIGTDVSGTLALPNHNEGIYVGEETHHNIIGDGNLVSGNGMRGIWLYGAYENQIKGTLIGTDYSGTIAIGNGFDGDGLVIGSGSHNNLIGGETEEDRNIVSGNTRFGIALWNLGTQDNQILGNYIGVDVSGASPLGNGNAGIRITAEASHNIIGGTAPGSGNVISCNERGGISIGGTGGSTGNQVLGNIIGSDPSRSVALGNLISGIALFGAATNNVIGLDEPGAGNYIAHNIYAGVCINLTSSEVSNSVSANSFYSNGEAGIDLSQSSSFPYTDGVTENDPGDGDEGPNHLQNFPESLNVGVDDGGDLKIQYLVDSDLENSEYPIKVEFFQSDEDGEGQRFLYSNYYTGDNHELGLKTIVLGPVANFDLEMGDYIVATATDTEGNTSEFSHTTQVTTYVGVDSHEILPDEFTLEQNYPNPFNPTTIIRFGLPKTSDIRMTIYDLQGRVVMRYSENNRPAGWVNYEWNGSNMFGELVGTGVYLCRLEAGVYSKSIKMVYLK